MPRLLDTMVRSLTPLSRTTSIKSAGTPQMPNPPTAISWPSVSTSASAWAALSPILDPETFLALILAG